MKTPALMLTLLALMPHTLSLAGERELGSGGNDAVAEFLEMARSIRDDLRAFPSVSAHFSANQFEFTISDTPVLGKNCETQRCIAPFVGSNGRRLVTDSIACNFLIHRRSEAFRRIEVCNQGWREAASETRRLIVLHEYIPLITESLDYNYELSRSILERIDALKAEQAQRAREDMLRSEQVALEAAARAQAAREEEERIRQEEQELRVREEVRQEREAARLAAEAEDTFPLIGEVRDEQERRRGDPIHELTLGVGGGVQSSQEGTENVPHLEGVGSLRFDANYMLGNQGENDPSDELNTASLEVSLRTLFGASTNQPVYQVRGDLSGGAFVLGAVWIAMEANQFNDMREEIVRTMLSPAHLQFRKDGKDYMLIRVGAGAYVRHDSLSPRDAASASVSAQSSYGVSAALSFMGRFSSFFIELDSEYDQVLMWGRSTDCHPGVTSCRVRERGAARVSAELELGKVLNFIFPNDEIRLRGRIVRYTEGNRRNRNDEGPETVAFPQVTELSAGLYYQARFGN